MKTPSNPICIHGDCERKEVFRSLSGHPFCSYHFFFSKKHSLKSIWYWFTWHFYRKNRRETWSKERKEMF